MVYHPEMKLVESSPRADGQSEGRGVRALWPWTSALDGIGQRSAMGKEGCWRSLMSSIVELGLGSFSAALRNSAKRSNQFGWRWRDATATHGPGSQGPRAGLSLAQHQQPQAGALQGDVSWPGQNRLARYASEKVRIANRMHAELQAVCPGLRAITVCADSQWFLGLLACRDDLRQIARLRTTTLRKIPRVGIERAAIIAQWQRQAQFSDDVEA